MSVAAGGKEALYTFKERLEFGPSATTTGPSTHHTAGRAYNFSIQSRFQLACQQPAARVTT